MAKNITDYVRSCVDDFKHFVGIDSFPVFDVKSKEITIEKSLKEGFDSTAAVFCTESIGDTMQEEKSFLRKIVLYSMESGKNIQEILLDHRYFGCSICDYEEGTDILFYTRDRLEQNCLLWFRWDKQKNQMIQILDKTIENSFSDYTLIAEGKSAALISYSAEKNELQSISEEEARPFLKLVGNEIMDLQVESNGTVNLLSVSVITDNPAAAEKIPASAGSAGGSQCHVQHTAGYGDLAGKRSGTGQRRGAHAALQGGVLPDVRPLSGGLPEFWSAEQFRRGAFGSRGISYNGTK